MARVVLIACADCQRMTVPETALRRWPHLRTYPRRRARGLCNRCYFHAQAEGRLVDFERQSVARDELLEEWVLLRSDGASVVTAAPRLGMRVEALERALHRAVKAGDDRGRHSCAGVWAAKREAAS